MTTDEPTPSEHGLYLTALANGGRLVPPLTADPAALAGLVARGLLVRTAGGYTAVSPRTAGDRRAAGLRTEATRLLVRAERLPDALAPLSAAFDATRRPAPEPSYVEGPEAIRHRLSLLVAECREELLTAQPGTRRRATLRLSLTQDVPLLMTGRRIRTIYQPVVRRQPEVIEYARTVVPHGSRIRLLDEAFDRMIIVDRATAVVSAQADHGAAAFITDRATVDALVATFERDWRRAAVVDWSADGPHPVADRIGRLLARGFTQRAVAARIGLSERSVAGHIAGLRERHGARTLFQLGWLMRGDHDGPGPHRTGRRARGARDG
ncbi:LuxR family transcriptional regulator [Kitasatospora sp. NPDC056184]|uniref:LuxR family transcriptional regulator n=1 Tax=Kitasatospora sp. NPDC056184 TaxID=3345738 RepID=UPI0035D725B6